MFEYVARVSSSTIPSKTVKDEMLFINANLSVTLPKEKIKLDGHKRYQRNDSFFLLFTIFTILYNFDFKYILTPH